MAAVLMVWLLSVNPYLDQGRAEFRRLQYERAEASLRLAQRIPSSSRDETREAADLLARTLAAQGRGVEAEDAYRALLIRDPAAPAPRDAAPKIQRLFLRAKERLYPRGFVALEPLPAPVGRVAIRVMDPWSQVAWVGCIEGAREEPLEVLDLEARGHCPASPARVEARDAAGAVLARVDWKDAVAEPTSVPAPVVVAAPGWVVPEKATLARKRPRPAGWYVLGGSVALAGGALGMGLVTLGDSSKLERPGTAAAADAIYTRARQHTLATQLLAGASVLTAGVGIWLLAWKS